MRHFLKTWAICSKTSSFYCFNGHMNKGKSSKSSYRGLGIIYIPATTRSALICGELKNSDDVRAVVQDKSILVKKGNPFALKVNDNGVEWLENCGIDLDEQLEGTRIITDKERAKE